MTAYAVIRTGGSIGEKPTNIIKTYETKEQAQQHARRLNRMLSPGEKSYYKIRYSVKPITDREVY